MTTIIKTHFTMVENNKKWFTDGKLHRDNDLPAIIWNNGDKEWWKNGIRHRDNNLPAVVCGGGHSEWWFDGKYQNRVKTYFKPNTDENTD